jgi:chromate transporter
MAYKLCPDFPRRLLALGAGALLVAMPRTPTQLGVIAGGGLLGFLLYRNVHATDAARPATLGPERHVAATTALVTFALLLVVLPLLASATHSHELAVVDSFYRAGSLVFGGGHVVLPLLRAELVPHGWLGDDQFLAGYGAAQAMPGPLFSFAAYLGAIMAPGPGSWVHGVVALLAIFLPAWLLIAGTLPFWRRVRSQGWARAGLAGTNAAVVGVLLAALYHPVITESVRGVPDAAVAVLGLVSLQLLKSPSWVVVAACAAAGQWLLPR